MLNLMIPPTSMQLFAQLKHNLSWSRVRPGHLNPGRAEAGLTMQERLVSE